MMPPPSFFYGRVHASLSITQHARNFSFLLDCLTLSVHPSPPLDTPLVFLRPDVFEETAEPFPSSDHASLSPRSDAVLIFLSRLLGPERLRSRSSLFVNFWACTPYLSRFPTHCLRAVSTHRLRFAVSPEYFFGNRLPGPSCIYSLVPFRASFSFFSIPESAEIDIMFLAPCLQAFAFPRAVLVPRPVRFPPCASCVVLTFWRSPL